jgi:hypothetical protein
MEPVIDQRLENVMKLLGLKKPPKAGPRQLQTFAAWTEELAQEEGELWMRRQDSTYCVCHIFLDRPAKYDARNTELNLMAL